MAWWIFQNVVITAALAAVAAMVCRVGRIGPVGRHALWVIVLVKFVTPPLVVWPWAAPDPLGVARLDVRPQERLVAADAAAPMEFTPRAEADLAAAIQPEFATESLPADSAGGAAGLTGAAVLPWLLGLWAAGSGVVLVIESVRLARLARRVRSAGAADPAIVRRVAALSERLGLRPIPVATLPGSSSPVVWCLGRPRLLWPADLPADSTDACIDGLLVHELAHVKRGDHLVGWIELAAGVVWWWNPLFWFVRSALREQAELACDAWVISALPHGRRAYAESLLALSGADVRGASSISSSMAVVGIRATSRRSLERRLVMIMKGRASLRLPWVGLLCLALIGAATLPAWATGGQQPTPAQQTPPPTPAVTPVTPAQTVPVERVAPVHPAAVAKAHVEQQRPPAPAVAVPVTPTHAQVAPIRPVVAPTPARVQPVIRQHVAVEPTSVTQQERLHLPVQQRGRTLSFAMPTHLTEEGQKIVQAFQTDRDAIQAEADKKIQARQEALNKELQALQDQYAKAGKLDEAVAIRDYLRSGALNRPLWIRR